MKDFFKMLGASVLGCLLVFTVGTFFMVGIAAALLSAGIAETGAIPHKAILQIDFEKPILEQYSSNPVSRLVPFGLYQDDGTGCYDLVSAIDRAADDSRIEMIYLNTNYLTAGIAHIEEIRDALKRFRSSGKAVIAYSDSYSQAGYYLASIADKVLLNPQGEVGLRGFSISARYYKGLMDELGVEAQLIRHGTYKSGGEPYTLPQMSPQERTQLAAYIQSAWNHWSGEIAAARQISVQTVNQTAEQAGCFQPSEALSLQLIDQALYKDGVIDYLCTLQGVQAEKQLRTVRMETYMAAKPLSKAKAKIAVLFAGGTLNTGTGAQDIMSDNYLRTICRLRADSSVKAVVLRVNSPGGDARAAAAIHRELQLLKEQKPIVVSIGDEAASGGYWISCAGDCLFAAPTSLTGSIGAYAIAYNGQKGVNKWLKVNVETVKTHGSSDMGSLYRPMTPKELERVQQSIDQTYQHFVETVSIDRVRAYDEIDALAQGRIWSGQDAFHHKLIDKIGGLTDAVSHAAGLAGLTEYHIEEYPAKNSFLERLIHSSSAVQSTFALGADPSNWARQMEQIVEQAIDRGVQAKVPFMYTLNY